MVHVKETPEQIVERLKVYPIKDEIAFKHYVEMLRSFWSFEDFNANEDRESFEALPECEKRLARTLFAFFTVGDSAIVNNLDEVYMREAKEERKYFLTVQSVNETNHKITYANFGRIFAGSDEELLRVARESEATILKVKFIEEFMNTDIPLFVREFASACSEGIFFGSQFNIATWFQSRGRLQKFGSANKAIRVDENKHCDAFNQFCVQDMPEGAWNAETKALFTKILMRAIDIELQFVKELLPEPVVDIDQDSMSEYVKVVGNRQAFTFNRAMGYRALDKPYPDAKNPYAWADGQNLESKLNFFERESGSYETIAKGTSTEDNHGDSDVYKSFMDYV